MAPNLASDHNPSIRPMISFWISVVAASLN